MFVIAATFSALVASASPPSAPEPAPKEAAKPKKICRSEQLTTSRMPVRVCKTAAEWERARDDDGDRLKQINTNTPR